jgi:post-segregation antitoxin (ccd killing protein)
MTGCVYLVRMARVNVYLPDDLAAAVKAADLNVSSVAQAALADELAARDTSRWLDGLRALPRIEVPPEEVLDAVRAARDDFDQ